LCDPWAQSNGPQPSTSGCHIKKDCNLTRGQLNSVLGDPIYVVLCDAGHTIGRILNKPGAGSSQILPSTT
jgi:hypothetical protein